MGTKAETRAEMTVETKAAIEHFAGKLAYETDVSDVHAALSSGDLGFVVVDSRSREAWDQEIGRAHV